MLESILLIIPATLIMVAIPGPNAALIAANSLRYGLATGLTTVAGITLGLAVQLAFVVIGIAALVELMAEALVWLKWAGVAYLLYLGIRTWTAPIDDGAHGGTAHRRASLCQGVLIATSNPKTMLFLAAFVPQFVSGDAATTKIELSVLAAVYLAVGAFGDCLWAILASRARTVLNRYKHLHNKISGGFYCGAGIGLALARR